MPFDVGHQTAPATRITEIVETQGSEFVPDIQHIAPGIVLLQDGSLLAMVAIPGYPFDLESVRVRNIRRRQQNELFKNIADDNVTISTNLVHHAGVRRWTPRPFSSQFAADLFARYGESCLVGRLMANDWFLTVVVSPRFTPGRALQRQFGKQGRDDAKVGEGAVRQIEAAMLAIMSYLAPDGARRLGYREENGLLHSEIGEARGLILTCRHRPIPLANGRLSDAIYTERAVCGTRAIRLDALDGSRLCKILAFRDYPTDSRTGQLSQLLDLSVPFVLSQSFRCKSRAAAQTSLYLKKTRMGNAGDAQTQTLDNEERDLKYAERDVVGGDSVRGDHNLTLAVYADSLTELNRAAAEAATIFQKAGATAIAEDGNSFAAYWTQLPGNPEWLQGRSGEINTRNLTALSSLEGYPTGAARGYWGAPLLRFVTPGGTAYDYHAHVGEIGHTMFFGRTGSGKTLLMTLLMTSLEQHMRERGSVVYFDKDQGAELAIRAAGGSYLALRAGADSGMAPLRGLANTAANRAFLSDWLTSLIMLDGRGPLQPETAQMLARAVARQMRMVPELRRFGAVRAFLGFGKGGDGVRLDQWCQGGALGWMFDGDRDEVRLDARLTGFDMTQILEHFACPAAGAYLIHRVKDLFDGRRVAVICDECRFYLLNPLFSKTIEDFALTMRKKEGILWLAAQQPEHITGSSIGSSLLSQCQTVFMYADKSANPAEYIDRMHCTPAMFRALTETMPALPYRTVLIKRDGGSAILRTDLIDMAEEVAILSGRSATTGLIPTILQQTGDNAAAFVAEFRRRYRQGVTA